jgi:hypothetical protein
MQDLEKTLRGVADDHYTSQYECDLCGYHTSCSCSNERDVGSDHQAEKIIEAALEWLRQERLVSN